MLKLLSTTEVASALTYIHKSLASTILTDVVERSLTEVMAEKKVLRSDDPETVSLRMFLFNYSEYMDEEALQLCSRIPIFCCDLPICNAISRRAGGSECYVIVFSGLLNVMTYRLCLANLLTNLDLMLEQKCNDIETAKFHLKTLGFNAQALSYWFYILGGSLPNFFDIFSENLREQVRHGLGGALSYLVLHEIGHIALGHLDSNYMPAPSICSDLDFEDATAWKSAEFEADYFAISHIRESLRPSMVSNMFIVLDLMSDLECFCLPHSYDHPLVINRINAAARALNLGNDDFFMNKARTILDQKKSLLLERSKTFSHVSCLLDIKMAIQNFKMLLPAQEECAHAVNILKSMYDGHDYIGDSIISA